MISVETRYNIGDLNRKWFELSPEGNINEAEWKMGSVFITGGVESSTQHTFIVEKKKGYRYCYALNEKNARRIFHKLGII